MNRLLLVRHATTRDTRRAAFPATTGAAPADGCAGLDPAGLAAARALAVHLPAAADVRSSFALRALQTAEALGVGPVTRDTDLAEADFGRWAGKTLAQVRDEDPAALAAWYADPGAAPHGGEALASVRTRAQRVLRRAAAAEHTVVAVSHGGLIKAALLEALQLPAAALWQLDVAPCSVTQLHWSGSHWRVVRTNWTPILPAVAA